MNNTEKEEDSMVREPKKNYIKQILLIIDVNKIKR